MEYLFSVDLTIGNKSVEEHLEFEHVKNLQEVLFIDFNKGDALERPYTASTYFVKGKKLNEDHGPVNKRKLRNIISEYSSRNAENYRALVTNHYIYDVFEYLEKGRLP